MDESKLPLLLHICKRGGLLGSVETTTSELGKELNTSQQTVSRKLRDLEEAEYIVRVATNNGVTINLTNKARTELQDLHVTLQSVLKSPAKQFKGKVVSGMGEGAYYISVDEYREQFKRKLGYVPYPGTLNLKVNPSDVKAHLIGKKPVMIEGFDTDKRSYGAITCYASKLNGVECALILPHRTHHGEDVVEIIASEYLRDKLKLEDDMELIVE